MSDPTSKVLKKPKIQKKIVEDNGGIFGSTKTDSTTFLEATSSQPNANNNVDLDKLKKVEKSPYYNMDHGRGVALIFNHEEFTGQTIRTGTAKDCKDTENVLTSLGFKCLVYQDLEYIEVLTKLKEASKEDYSEYDCLIIVVMTHGTPDKVYAKDRPYHLEEFWIPFVGNKCSTLVGKPKLIFLQACRGDKKDNGVPVTDSEPFIKSNVFSIPTMADLLIMYATCDDHIAFRSEVKGTWFIQSLCKELTDNAHEPLSTILINVTRRVAFDYEDDGQKQLPCTVSMLTKTLILKKKVPAEEKMKET